MFVEASNQNTNEIEISSDDDIIPSMNINFNISNEEISSINRISLDFSNWFTSYYIKNKFVDTFIELNLINIRKIQTGSHPSGAYGMSNSRDKGVVNEKSRHWTDSRISVLGAGVFPRTVAKLPTFPSLVAA